MRSISIELKIVVSIIVFTIFIVSLERYQISENIIAQFVASKKSKHTLLKETISPIIGLNLSLGLRSANKEYLDQIMKQNADLSSIKVLDPSGKTLYSSSKVSEQILTKDPNDMNFFNKNILDPVTAENLGSVQLYFFDHEYQQVVEKNKETTVKMFLLTFVLLLIFVAFVKREFRHLKKLSRSVLSYDPKENNFNLKHSPRTDEVGIIHNAIVSMVEKINSHAKLLDDINISLEQKIKERTQQLEDANSKLKDLAITDELTQVANRRHFTTHMKEIWELAKRKNAVVSVIMCDIDHFKDVNDTYGHTMGDEVLKRIAKIMKDSLLRSTDFVARFGGEEFVIILYDTKTDQAKILCERIQSSLGKVHGFELNGKKTGPVTLSFGISSMIPDIDNSSDDAVRTADIALYQAKNNDRNCIEIYLENRAQPRIG